jgi:type II secretory pathway pseudopilin PulG/uncharacterized membrane protein YciS (DUF1049 family)
MNESPRPEDLANSLLSQDLFFSSQEFAEHRRAVIQRLGVAVEREKRARRRTVISAMGCAAFFVLLYAYGIYQMSHTTGWPGWSLTVLALLVILSPLTALLLFCVYFFRYRLELVRARKKAREQSLADFSQQLRELRKELAELKKERKPEGEAGPSNPGSKGAFTLMELLVTIGVLVLLCSMLFPTIARGKSRAKTASCKNNLKQLGHALVMYEGDFRYYPGAGDCAVSINQWPYILRSTNSWVVKINPYIGTDPLVFSCPEYDAPVFRADLTTKWEAYGYNGSGSADVYYALQNLGLGLGKGNFVNSAALKAASDMIALGDLQYPPSVGLNVISPSRVMAGGGLISIIPERHAAGACMVFADSHVEWAKHSRWTAENDSVRSRWNNDHQPHPETW